MALYSHLMKFVCSMLKMYNSFRQIIKPHCKEQFLKKLASCSMSPFGLSAISALC